MRFGRGLWAALLLLVLLLAPLSAHAIGEVTGRLGGVVTIDGTKDGLSGVPIVVRSKQLIGGSRTVETGDDGSYTFQSLPPGTYELEARIEGFAPVEQRGIVVVAGQLAAVDVVLRIGQITETKQIIEKRNPILNPESAVSTTTLDNQKVSRTPVFRQVQSIAQLAAGVGPGTTPSVRGGLSRYTRFLVDGLDTSDIVTGGLSSPMNFDAVEQYTLFTGAMDAEYNSLGLVQNMVTRSGGNNFTVDASVVIQPTAFYLRNRYSAQLPQQNGALIYDDRDPPVRDFYSVNANVGGPIVKDRLWFFTSFQFNYNRAMTTVPPFPWLGITDDTDRFRDTYTYLGRAKLTWQVTTGTRLSVSFNIDRNFVTNGAQQTTLAAEAERRTGRGGEWLVVLLDTAISPKWMFQMQAGFTTKRSVEDTMRVGDDGQPDRLTPSHNLRTSDQFNGVTYINSALGWNQETKYRIQVDPTLLYSSMGLGGMHNVKIGAQFAYMSYQHNVGIAGGRNYVDTVPGTPCNPADASTHVSCSQVTEYPDSLPNGDVAGAGWSTTADAINLGFFAQDRYTIKRYLTLVPGFRFDLGVLRDYQGNRLGTLLGYGPRLSAVYDLLHDRSTLISAHYGRHNDIGNAFVADRGNPQQLAIQKNWDPATSSFAERNRSGGPGGQLFADKVTPPSLDEVSAGIRREMIAEMIVGVDYTYRRYANMWTNTETNQVWDPAGTRIVGYVNGERRRIFLAETPEDAQRTYHGLDLWVQGNPGHWGLVGSYTLAFTDGTVSDYFSAYKQNARLNPLYYGPMSDNYRHTLKGAIDYNFDFGLNASVRMQYRTGAPQWKVFQSPEDASFSLYRSPRGTSTGTRVNDPTTWAEFKLPDQFILDLQFTYNFQKLIGQRFDLMLLLFNIFNTATPTSIDQRNGTTFGAIQFRQDNFNAEIIIRYRY